MTEPAGSADLVASRKSSADETGEGNAAVATAKPAHSKRLRRDRDAGRFAAGCLPRPSSIWVLSCGLCEGKFLDDGQTQRTGPRGKTVRYDRKAYLKIVLIFLQAGRAEKVSQAMPV